jgi:metallo-beta-lactamase class B
MRSCLVALVAFALLAPDVSLTAQSPTPSTAQGVTPNCSSCAAWNTPQAPFRVFGNTYYVGTHGLSAVLITSERGHILIDGGLAESAPLIAASIRGLGFRVEDVRVMLNSHVHFDHAGGMAALQRLSGAEVFASTHSRPVLESGNTGTDDPQFGELIAIEAVPNVRAIPADGVVRVGDLSLHALATGGHTPGGTSWTWTSCEGDRCLALVYGDSQSAISAEGFLFSSSTTYPRALADFEAGFAALEGARCDILLTPHPDGSALWERLARREGGDADAMRDSTACRRYAAAARDGLARRLVRERQPGGW